MSYMIVAVCFAGVAEGIRTLDILLHRETL
ncbi:MAG: hypothetical protein UV63_C0008G0016 [Microgenomates group bacterium GW2011_GWC1_43_11]|nr:MAG: hypothetical protein UV63_C0008G0016 [Microgenomates group bacterium GW2011_GWC1_43_11]